jgi:flagellar biosynthesis/type III secretory pathway M-ring protein FliF/YscJ
MTEVFEALRPLMHLFVVGGGLGVLAYTVETELRERAEAKARRQEEQAVQEQIARNRAELLEDIRKENHHAA